MAKKKMNIPLVLPKVDSPSNPPATHISVYPKSDGKLYRKNSLGEESEIGGGGLPIIFNESVALNTQKEVILFENKTNANCIEVVVQYKHGQVIYRLETVLNIDYVGNQFKPAKQVEYISDLGTHDYSWLFSFNNTENKLTLTFNTSVAESGTGVLNVQAQIVDNP